MRGPPLISTLTLFENVHHLTLEQAIERFQSTAPSYEGRDGLLVKRYIYADDGSTLGGFYLWESREAADALFTPEWHEKVSEVYGVRPSLTYFHAPVSVVNMPQSRD